ncbi:hypothetical protein [Afipia broomeae]|uniref:Uncharacterized protein n=1 Tax=Afipia broomeae ATCC 49717 TaxID=883078 RepID=K8PKR6_9BRAD|nr:hypothetical protein [Afipia broomeae]EKS41344.1 hypothetical protein HMPREF9695_00436 [Afipia broomeae ATCC 49717]
MIMVDILTVREVLKLMAIDAPGSPHTKADNDDTTKPGTDRVLPRSGITHPELCDVKGGAEKGSNSYKQQTTGLIIPNELT